MVERIEQEIVALKQTLNQLGEELHQAYRDYLAALGQAVRQQLILAAYRLCTQGYPQQFLQLSLRQRQNLQDALKQLTHKLQTDLQTLAETPISAAPAPETEASDHTGEPLSPAPTDDWPETLIRWQAGLEKGITEQLHQGSHAANRLLQQEGILPPHLPEPLLAVVAQAETGSAMAGSPNLLNLVIEVPGEASETKAEEIRLDGPKLQIMTIHLRLAEVELADPALMAARHKIRPLVTRLKALRQEYQKKQRQWAVAAAEAAWRAGWTND